jgi:hypothetical protein
VSFRRWKSPFFSLLLGYAFNNESTTLNGYDALKLVGKYVSDFNFLVSLNKFFIAPRLQHLSACALSCCCA